MTDQTEDEIWDTETDFISPVTLYGLDPALAGGADLLHGLVEGPRVRERLHVFCALYAHASSAGQRLALLDRVEEITLQLAHILAVDLLDAGWKPGPNFNRARALADLGVIEIRASRAKAA